MPQSKKARGAARKTAAQKDEQPSEEQPQTKPDDSSEEQPQTQPEEQPETQPEEQPQTEEPPPSQEQLGGETKEGDEGPIPARFSGEPAPEPSVTYSPEEFAAQELAARQAHNERTGGGKVREGELREQREEHNRRVGGATS